MLYQASFVHIYICIVTALVITKQQSLKADRIITVLYFYHYISPIDSFIAEHTSAYWIVFGVSSDAVEASSPVSPLPYRRQLLHILCKSTIRDFELRPELKG